MFDSQIMVPVLFLSLAVAGLVCASFALFLYLRFERGDSDKCVPVALAAFGVHYTFIFAYFVHTFLRVLAIVTVVPDDVNSSVGDLVRIASAI